MQGSGAQEPAVENDMATPQGAQERDKMAVWHLDKCGSSTKEKEDGATIMKDGPLFATVKDFWRMVWQENVYYVVMLCRVLEEGKRRSAECFEPTIEHSTLYGPIKVTLKKTKWEGPIKFSQLELEYLHESRQINHYQWQDWVDSTAPTSGTLVELLKKVRGKSTVGA
ncbi:unnamed protein product [Nippostrongylus brasiliensis]|uniref:Tyrosine-protein phosphatase domain-containing protein n=1 Tax=Nippostrongylus brasiliensis TaxID=27835 RepID=A0A0N4Y1T8_NIPBR|nr:unnamed protein product [Nippostrongylus brasiliensis]